jgi:(E)-4-hydroxy-3-methylbut-2-enyl-diphosphate synthase
MDDMCPFRERPVIKYLGRFIPPTLISCPTCGRCKVPNFFELAERVDNELTKLGRPLKVAVMGCVVNGPGEARGADVGIAFGNKGKAVIFKHGKKLKTLIGYDDAILELIEEIQHVY